jgi:hypothetical protein
MKDGLPRSYDEWRTRNADDEQEEQERRLRKQQAREDRADYDRDRQKDEPREKF